MGRESNTNNLIAYSLNLIGQHIDLKVFAFLSLLSILLIYLSFAFSMWTFNPKEWGSDNRTFFVVLCFLSECLVVAATMGLKEKRGC